VKRCHRPSKQHWGLSETLRLSTFDYEDLTVPTESENRSDVSAEFIIPLLRYIGQANTGALETAERSRLTATESLSKPSRTFPSWDADF
jgi:hypothetical protein